MNRGRLAFLTGTHAVNDLYQALIPALLPFMVLERGYSYTAVSGLMLAATGLSSVVQPLFGLYADKHPRAWLVPVGFMVAALGVVLAGLSGDYWLTWCAAALCGLGTAAFHPPATVAARAAGGASQRAMSVFSVGGTIGASFAPMLAAATVSGGLARSHLLGLPALVMGLLWLLMARRTSGETSANKTARRNPVTAINDWRAFALLVAVIVGWSIPYVTAMSMLSLFIGRELGGSSFQAAAALTSFTASGAVGTLLGGWLGDRRGRMWPIRAGYLLALPAFAGLAMAPNVATAMACTALVGLFMFMPFAPQVTLAQDYLPRNPATASGITLGLALSVGGMVSPLFGLLSDARGLRFTLTAVLCVLAIAALMALRLRNRNPQAEAGANGVGVPSPARS